MKVLFDSIVIIDAVTQGENANTGAKSLFLKAASAEIDGYLVSKQISDIYYVLKKYVIDERKRKEFVHLLLRIFTIIPFKGDDLEGALSLNGMDYEDDVLIYIAEKEKLNYIITNNTKDFVNSKVSVLKPDELINEL